MAEQSPLEEISQERIDALLKRDWDRYRCLGNRLVEMLDERRAITQEGHVDWEDK